MNRYLYAFLMVGLAANVLVGCGPQVRPDVAENYQVELLHPTPHGELERFQVRMREAVASEERERSLLYSSSEPHVVEWRTRIEHLQGVDPLEQLDQVNLIVNEEVEYLSDYDHWKVADRWGYPFEALVEGGDCEDFAILKMESLIHLGWEEDQFAVLIGFSNFSDPPVSHAVLMATLESGEQVILDSLENFLELPRKDHHFRPLYAFTREHVYHVKPIDAPGMASPIESTAAGR